MQSPTSGPWTAERPRAGMLEIGWTLVLWRGVSEVVNSRRRFSGHAAFAVDSRRRRSRREVGEALESVRLRAGGWEANCTREAGHRLGRKVARGGGMRWSGDRKARSPRSEIWHGHATEMMMVQNGRCGGGEFSDYTLIGMVA